MADQLITFEFTHDGTKYAVAVNDDRITSLSRWRGDEWRRILPEDLTREGYAALWEAADEAVIDAEKGPH